MTAFPARTRELEVGEALGPYRLEELLGKGGTGLVFRAVHEPAGQVVALKILRQALAGDDTFKRRFAHEARASAQVSHPRLVPILDAGELDGRQYLAMAYVTGPTLEARIQAEGRLGAEDVLRLAADVGAALDALHARGIVHRDVKPSNVLFDRDGAALLTDFGLAKGRGYTVLTEPGQVFGTLNYVAPELIRGEAAGPATDLYALGCVVYEAATGAPPFAAADPVQVGVGHLQEEPPDPRARGADWTPALSDALLRALAKERGDRPASGADFARGLRSASKIAHAAPARHAYRELGGYRIVRKLGGGAGGSVWEGLHQQLGHRAALKLLDPWLTADEEVRERFLLESRLVAAIDHPNIVPIYGAGEDDGVLYIAMRCVEGGDLGELIRTAGPVEPSRALAILEQVAAALDAVHARGLVHRDVKPANILIGGGRAFLSDFGIAHRPRAPGAGGAQRFAGSLGYAAPEQLDGKVARPPADIYALGCVLYECLVGYRPFERDNDVAVLYAHLLDPPPRMADVRPELPRALDDVFARALAKVPDDRFATCGELIAAARAAAGVAEPRAAATSQQGSRTRPEQPPLMSQLPLPATPLLGRRRELDALEQLLGARGSRLVTLTGPAGAGKTRIALEAARAVQDRFAHGAVLVTLDALTDPSLVSRAIADALGLEERATPDRDALARGLARRLEDAELLLVLDGFERVLPAAPLVADLVAAAPGLRVLVTSQAALRLQGEREVQVASLELEAAVSLFVDRARSVHAGFTLDDDAAAAVAEICRRLDRLPLAIELAAARTKLLSPHALLARLENRLELLTGGARDLPSRHQTLRDAIDWTHELLDPGEQAVFARMAVFDGGCTPEGAEAVCGPPTHGALLDALGSLVDTGFEESLDVYRSLRDRRGEAMCLAQIGWLVLASGQLEQATAAATQSLEIARQIDDRGTASVALADLAEVALRSGDAERATRLFGEVLSLRLALDDRRNVANALLNLGRAELAAGDAASAAARLADGLALAREVADTWGTSLAQISLANVALERGDVAGARSLAADALESCRARGDRRTAAECLSLIALLAAEAGRRDEATRLHGAATALRAALSTSPGPLERALEDRYLARVPGAPSDHAPGAALGFDEAVELALSGGRSAP